LRNYSNPNKLEEIVSNLYLVATPIGNLEDISARALRILAEVRLIAAEDTRHTRKLLAHYDIHTPTTSYYEHNKTGKLEQILKELSEGDVAVVSDAGTPGLNDPGYELVKEALKAGHQVRPVPGPSAPIAALVASGLPTDAFLYLGYLPRKSSERVRLLKDIANLSYTLIFLEVPHRLLGALDDLRNILGDRDIAVARELTKMYEEIFRGKISAAQHHFTIQPPRGEFTLVVSGYKGQQTWPEERLREVLREQLSLGISPSKLASQLAAQSHWPRREVYRLVHEEQEASRAKNKE
jgi:16S rRNA (cytidine1402-2'-O)-methyltransferase